MPRFLTYTIFLGEANDYLGEASCFKEYYLLYISQKMEIPLLLEYKNLQKWKISPEKEILFTVDIQSGKEWGSFIHYIDFFNPSATVLVLREMKYKINISVGKDCEI